MKNENLLYLSELLADEEIDTSILKQKIALLINHFKESNFIIKKQVKKLDRHDVKTLGEYYSAELTIQDFLDLLEKIQILMFESKNSDNSAMNMENSNIEDQEQRRQIVCDLFAKYFADRSTANINKFFNISWCHANLGLNSLPLLAEVETVSNASDVTLKKSNLPSQCYWSSPIMYLNNKKYVICNQWTDDNITNLLIWFRRNGITSD